MTENDFIPILLGSDINVYGMARSFHEQYDIKVHAIAGAQLAPTRFSKIVDIEIIEGFAEDPIFFEAMKKIAKRYENETKKVILIACGDGYAELIAKHKDELSKTFVCPYINYDLLKKLNNKESFYQVCEEFGLPYPSTTIITKAMYDNKAPITNPYEYPVALKPANSVEWLDIHFEGRKKAFTIHSQVEFNNIVAKIYQNGYTSDLILQDFIPGDDSNMRVLNAYVDQYHQVKMMCLGHPLLEDPAPDAIGNYVAILPEYNQQIYDVIKRFLESIQFTGYANFDMKFDSRDQQFKFFEINLRQGRSSFFVTLNGYNLSKWVVEDYVNQSLKDQPTVYANQDPNKAMLWLGVPTNVFKKYAKENADKKRALELLTSNHYGTTVFYNKDESFKRYILQKYAFYLYNGRYKEYFAENKG